MWDPERKCIFSSLAQWLYIKPCKKTFIYFSISQFLVQNSVSVVSIEEIVSAVLEPSFVLQMDLRWGQLIVVPSWEDHTTHMSFIEGALIVQVSKRLCLRAKLRGEITGKQRNPNLRPYR